MDLRKLIDSSISPLQIFDYYMGTAISLKRKYKSKFREEENASLSFFKKGGEVLFYDWKVGGDCYKFVMEMFNVSYPEALKIIAKDFNLGEYLINSTKYIPPVEKRVVEAKKVPKIEVQLKEFTPTEAAYWSKYGYTLTSLKRYKIYSVAHLFINEVYIKSSTEKNPIYCFLFKYNGIVYKKIYQPTNKQFKFISDLNGVSEKIWQGEEQINPSNNEVLIITKSLKDAGSIKLLTGIEAVAPQSEVGKWEVDKISKFKKDFKRVILYFDNDTTGIRRSKELSTLYDIPYILNKKEVKDFTHSIDVLGVEETIVNLKTNIWI